MRYSPDETRLQYNEVHEHYNGYIIEWAANPSPREPGRWMCHYRARKDGAATLAASIANLQDSLQDAEAKAIELAKEAVDQAVAK